MSNKPPKCDTCSRRIRRNHHELRLSDAMTGQIVGHYHARPECQASAAKYLVGGAVLLATYVHPDRCGADQELCAGGYADDEEQVESAT